MFCTNIFLYSLSICRLEHTVVFLGGGTRESLWLYLAVCLSFPNAKYVDTSTTPWFATKQPTENDQYKDKATRCPPVLQRFHTIILLTGSENRRSGHLNNRTRRNSIEDVLGIIHMNSFELIVRGTL